MQLSSKAPIASPEMQKLILNIGTTDCAILTNLNEDMQYALLLSAMFLQRAGALTKIIGPECTFLGEVEELAAIEDNSLKISAVRESLYYIPSFRALIVTNRAKNAIAYGMIMDDESTDPLEYFLDNRSDAKDYAQFAAVFSEATENLEPPTFMPPEKTATVTQSSARSTYSVATTVASTSSVFSTLNNEPTAPTPSFVASSTASSAYDEQYSEAASSDAAVAVSSEENVQSSSAGTPIIQPLGPEPEATQEQSSGYGILMIVLAFIAIAVAIVVIKTRTSKEAGLIDE